jgi:hypothetical protein
LYIVVNAINESNGSEGVRCGCPASYLSAVTFDSFRNDGTILISLRVIKVTCSGSVGFLYSLLFDFSFW